MRNIIALIKFLFRPFYYFYTKKILWAYLACTEENSNVSKKSILRGTYHIAHIEIDDYTFIHTNAQITYAKIGKFCSIGPNFFCGWGIHPINGISTSPMFYSTQMQNGYSLVAEDKIQERKLITIGNDVFIGANVTILDGITIGDGAVIGAGAIVSKDIPPYAVAVGSPIRIIKYRFEEQIIEQLLELEWWHNPELLVDVEQYFFDIRKFLTKHKK